MPYVPGVATGGDEVTLYFEVAGDGPAVVLLHPWPLTSATWELQVAALVAAGFRVVTFDRRGFGRSSRPWNGYDYPTLAGDVHAVVSGLDLADFSIVGASMGAAEVVQYLKDYGDQRVRSVVLASGILPAVIASAVNPAGGMSQLLYEDYLGSAGQYRLAFLDQLCTSIFSVKGELQTDDLTREHAYRTAAESSGRAIVECLRTWAGADMRLDLATITVPTLVLHGADDSVFPVESSGLRTYEAIARARLEMIEDAPHGANVTHAAQFNRLVTNFLLRPQ